MSEKFRNYSKKQVSIQKKTPKFSILAKKISGICILCAFTYKLEV